MIKNIIFKLSLFLVIMLSIVGCNQSSSNEQNTDTNVISKAEGLEDVIQNILN